MKDLTDGHRVCSSCQRVVAILDEHTAIGRYDVYTLWCYGTNVVSTSELPPVPRGKQKVKTDVITLRVEPHLKIAAKVAAEKEHRDLSNWIEVQILKRCAELQIETTPQSQETSE